MTNAQWFFVYNMLCAIAMMNFKSEILYIFGVMWTGIAVILYWMRKIYEYEDSNQSNNEPEKGEQ